MVATAARLAREGFPVMPHFPARIIKDRPRCRLDRALQGEAGREQALLLAAAWPQPAGDFDSSMQLMETGAFDGFERLHVAGHPEGNKDIDPDGSDRMVMEALRWKQAFSRTHRCADGDGDPVLLRGAAGDRLGQPAARPKASTCRSISASRGPPSCRR
jgi:hypothetical protein